MKVAEIMSSPAYPCSAHEALSRAAQLMWDHDLGVVPVVDREGRAIAVITDRDICMAAFMQGLPLTELRVQQAMSKLVYTCHPEDKVSAAERTMRVHQVRRLPVVDDAGRLLGMLSVNDLCRARAGAPLSGLGADVVTTLATIGRARRIAPNEVAPAPPIVAPTYRATDALSDSPRVPPPPVRDPTTLFRF